MRCWPPESAVWQDWPQRKKSKEAQDKNWLLTTCVKECKVLLVHKI